jgi:alpha-glucosidase
MCQTNYLNKLLIRIQLQMQVEFSKKNVMYCLSKKMRVFLPTIVFSLGIFASTVSSPDGKIKVEFSLSNAGKPNYSVSYNSKTVIETSALGLETSDELFTTNFRIVSETQKRISDKYMLHSGKQTKLKAVCNQKEYVLQTPQNSEIRIQFRVYNEGVAFRYLINESKKPQTVMLKELTTFDIPDDAVMWISKYVGSSYQTFFTNGETVKTPSPNKDGSWGYPALFKTDHWWMLLTEANLTENYAATHLLGDVQNGSFSILFPDSAEALGHYNVLPTIRFPFASPWRVLVIGATSADILQSSLVTHVSEPSKIKDESWIKAGRSSWSWWSDTQSAKDYDKLKSFVDLATNMGWEYSLVDAKWNLMEGGDIKQLIDYATTKKIGIWLWYNSGGIHNKVMSEQPRDIMHDPVLRRKEFEKISQWGVKGVKVDFFESDKQELIKLYLDILRDAAEYQIMVNFHGCTAPRGWERTYPNLLTMEAVAGAECYLSNRPWWAIYGETSPTHNTILPFTRNVIGSMDYTPVTFTKKVQPHLTTNAHELALSVVFESGLQVFADKVDAYSSLHPDCQKLLQTVPASWDETKYLAGEPGKYVVIARRNGKKWYVGGINGQAFPQEVTLDLSRLKLNHLVTDNTDLIPKSIKNHKGSTTIKMDTYGGFVIY